MHRMPKISYAMIVFVLLGLTACASTKTISEWRDETYKGGPFNNILIIGVSQKPSVRRSFENTFTSALQKQKVKAVASSSIMAMETKVSKETVEKAISGKGINAVLVTYMVGVEQREVYTPPRYTPTASYYGGYYRHYSHARRSVYEPGYYTTYKTVKLETSLYEVATGKLVWSTQSETGSSESTEQLIHSKIKSVIDQLKKQRLI